MADKKNKIEVAANDRQVEIWLEKNWKKALAVIVLLLVIGMTVFGTSYYRKAESAKTMKLLAEAEVADLAELLEKNSGVPGAASARMRLADDLLNKKDYQAAREQYALVVSDRYALAENRSRAKLNMAACDELAGKSKEAGEAYLQVMNDLSVSAVLRDEAGYQAGRIFAGLKDSRGKEILQKVAVSVSANQVNPRKSNAAALLKSLQ